MRRKLWLFPALLICANFCCNICAISAKDHAEEEKDSRNENHERPADVIDLSYEECSDNGTCEVITKFVKETPFRSQWQVVNLIEELQPSRAKRRIFGVDNRLRIRSPYTRKYPFSSTVAVRVGHNVVPTCSGIALTRSLFLTAAHCLLSSTGKLQVITRELPEVFREGVPVIGSGKLKGCLTQAAAEFRNPTVESDFAFLIVSKLSVGVLQRNDILKWSRVNETRHHVIWKRGNQRRRRIGKKNIRKFDYDYAVLRTVTPLDVTPMTIAAIGENNEGKEILKSGKTFMHFSAFDDKLPFVLRYRFCRMARVTRRKIFSKCDTVPKTAGAGVYVLMRNNVTQKVERKIIAIETGDYKIVSKDRIPFSSSLRITRLQFAQICYWVTKDYGKCRGMELNGKNPSV